MDNRAEAMIRSWMDGHVQLRPVSTPQSCEADRASQHAPDDEVGGPAEPDSGERGKWYCFAAGTAVRTATGSQPIESLAPGSPVLTFDWTAGGIREARVEDVERHNVEFPVFDLRAGEDVVTVTAGHRFAKGDVWTPVERLNRGSKCVNVRGKSSPISLMSAPRLERRTVYNVRVEGGDNYFVGHSGLMVRQY